MERNENNKYAPPASQVADLEPEAITTIPKQVIIAVRMMWAAFIASLLLTLIHLSRIPIAAPQAIDKFFGWVAGFLFYKPGSEWFRRRNN